MSRSAGSARRWWLVLGHILLLAACREQEGESATSPRQCKKNFSPRSVVAGPVVLSPGQSHVEPMSKIFEDPDDRGCPPRGIRSVSAKQPFRELPAEVDLKAGLTIRVPSDARPGTTDTVTLEATDGCNVSAPASLTVRIVGPEAAPLSHAARPARRGPASRDAMPEMPFAVSANAPPSVTEADVHDDFAE